MQPILHHYGISPYSEKIRLMLGYTRIAWHSAISPPNPPRPLLDPLTGGYRRIPVLQIGADIFCDSEIISTELAILGRRPELNIAHCSDEEQRFIRNTRERDFMAIVQTGKPAAILLQLAKRYWPWQILSLLRDRAAMVSKMPSPRPTRAELNRRVQRFTESLVSKLNKRSYLFAEQPTLADFAAYHLVWFADLTRSDKFARLSPEVGDWLSRMAAIGHGEYSKISQASLFKQARDHQPREHTFAKQHPLHAQQVKIQPTDYARDAVCGKLVGADENRYVLLRNSKQFGRLHIHLPIAGYEITEDL